MIRSIFEIARLQALESVRRQVHLITLFTAAIVMMIPAYVNAFGMGLQGFELVSKDFGLTLISYYGVAMSLILGSSVIPRDIERKTIYPILSRPIHRVSYIAGQFLGTATLIVTSIFILTTGLVIGIFMLNRHFDAQLYWGALGYSLESCVVIAACLCFSTVASPPLAGVLGFFLYVVGGLSAAFIQFFLAEDRGATALAGAVEALKGVFPNFEVFRLKFPLSHGIGIDPTYHLASTCYAGGWVLLFLLLAGFRFDRRDL